MRENSRDSRGVETCACYHAPRAPGCLTPHSGPPDPYPDCKQATVQTCSKNDSRVWGGAGYSRSVAPGGSARVATSAFDDSSQSRYDKLWRISVLRVVVSFLFRIAIGWINAHGIWCLVAGQ